MRDDELVRILIHELGGVDEALEYAERKAAIAPGGDYDIAAASLRKYNDPFPSEETKERE